MTKHEPDSHAEIALISQELCLFNMKLLPPDLSKSDINFKSIENLNRFTEMNHSDIKKLQMQIKKDTKNSAKLVLFIFGLGPIIGITIFLFSKGFFDSPNI